ncbi:hypothetical protein BKA67DRAFT_519033, partial [Truncatella angustata]
SLSREQFIKDFCKGQARYCSSILVNALLALGYSYSSQHIGTKDTQGTYPSGDEFFAESQRLLDAEENHHTLTTIQALSIMSLRQLSCGRDSESHHYSAQSIRLAIEMGLQRPDRTADNDEFSVKNATFWGAFALHHAWAVTSHSLPCCSSTFTARLPPKPATFLDAEDALWVPYTDENHPPTSREILIFYTKYLSWYDLLSDVLRLGHTSTPAVLFTHMYYHFAVLLLFRPFVTLSIPGSNILPRDVCFEAANNISALLHSYSALHTLQRIPSFVPTLLFATSIMHLSVKPNLSPPIRRIRVTYCYPSKLQASLNGLWPTWVK